MKKYKILTISLLAAFGTLVSSCDRVDYGDLNSQQVQPEKGDAEALLRGAMARYFTVGGRDYLGNATNYVQYQTQITYTSESLYADTEGDWDQYYAVILPGLKIAEETTTSPKGNPANLNATAKLFKVMVWKRVTDTFGDVPYFEALQGVNNLTPGYTKQEDIYKDLIKQAKEARDQFSATAFTLDSGTDLAYKGNITRWRKFANSLIMNMAVQLSKKYPLASEYAAIEFNAALTNTFTFITANTDNMLFTPDNNGGVRNPFSGLRSSDYAASRQFTDALKGSVTTYNPTSNHTLDSRNRIFISSPTGNGYPYGNLNTPNLPSSVGSKSVRLNASYVRNASSIRPIFCAANTFLDRAEAAALGWTGESATGLLSSGITASYDQWNLIAVATNTTLGITTPYVAIVPTTYAAARVADANDVTIGLERVIGEEKWVASFPNGFDAWANQRKTGFPALVPAVDALNGGFIPSRVRYPQIETTVNNAGLTQGVSGLFPASDKNTSKPWFLQ